ncbi:hypothetical protein F5Y09DRAFT_142650 [Xylaria sp. FL1042]|nr:hypothetical protein F5Y09DRAFT_142650 [Xylaria sp. FL1042]
MGWQCLLKSVHCGVLFPKTNTTWLQVYLTSELFRIEMASCQLCSNSSSPDDHNLVPIPFPWTFGTRVSPRQFSKPKNLEDGGAVVFEDRLKRAPLFTIRPQEDTGERQASSTTVSLAAQDFSSPARSGSRGHESELSPFGRGSNGERGETEDTSASAASSSLAPLALAHSTDRPSQTLTGVIQ